MDDATYHQLWQQRCNLLFHLAVSYSYHRRRQRFFDLLDKGTKAATVLLGATLLGEPVRQHLPWVAGAISGLGLLSLVFGYGERKQCHKELAEQFMALRATVESQDVEAAGPERLAAWSADFTRLNAKEPPALYALVTLCHNEQTLALGRQENLQPLAWHRRLLASWISFGPAQPALH